VSRLYTLLGRQIARFRHRAGLTQEELAEKTGYSVDFIGLVERGINAPTVARLEDVARAVGVEVWELFKAARSWESGNPRDSAKNAKKPQQRKAGEKRSFTRFKSS